MKIKALYVLLLGLAITFFAQSNYEILLSRPDITGLTGGDADIAR